MLKIHGIPRSRAFRCIWAAEEAQLPYELIPTSPGAATLHPQGKVPVLEDEDLVLFESLAINLHIAGKAGPPLCPEGADRDRALQWTLWAATEIEPHALQWALHSFLRPADQRDPALARSAAATLEPRFEALERHLHDRPYLLGTQFCIADCNLAGVLFGIWANHFDFLRHPRTRGWLDACLNRPGAKKARAMREV